MNSGDRFTVDTHLFRELGELLVGRDSTALIELIKNSYDADATKVIVHGKSLNDLINGTITISDNGTGMTRFQFVQGFLRIASRLKNTGERKSIKLRRRYTGAKGIGRLAAHKLAKHLEIESIPYSESEQENHRQSICARIDWDKVEEFETLEELALAKSDEAILLIENPVGYSAASGTTLRLSHLRRKWTTRERIRFFNEIQSFAPPSFLVTALRKSIISDTLLFKEPLVRESESDGKDFKVSLEGDFAAGDDYWRVMEEHAAWVIEIRCRPEESHVSYAIAPTKKMLREAPLAQVFRTTLPHPDPVKGPFFDARIFVRVGQLYGKNEQKVWTSESSGVRVFMEGFRVLPYGEAQNDWLKMDADYTRRSRRLDTLQEWGLDNLGLEEDKDAALSVFPNNNLFGGVFLTHGYAENLRTLVNREGFIQEAPYDHLVRLVRTGVDLCVRTHASATSTYRLKRREKRNLLQRSSATPSSDLTPPTPARSDQLKKTLLDTTEAISEARTRVLAIAEDDKSVKDLANKLNFTIGELKHQIDTADDLISEQSLLRVLASIGTQMASFIHEIKALLGASQEIERALNSIIDKNLFPEDKKELKSIAQAIGDLRRGLEREASYLTEIVKPDSHRRRSRQNISERFDVAKRLLALHAERRNTFIQNRIPANLKTNPMFPAELMAVFTNLLSNAIKAADTNGDISAHAFEDDSNRIHFIIQNTGVKVDLGDSERWFRPFESTTSEMNPILGQGMGLGLPITRMLLGAYNAEIRFVTPDDNFSTAVEVVFQGKE